MNEIEDPGVDHMSAMKVIDEISDKGGKCFIRILCGVSVAPESDTNRWNYKFTWACNVVLAGQGVQLNLFKKERTSIYPLQFI
jgi:hypothetical protein